MIWAFKFYSVQLCYHPSCVQKKKKLDQTPNLRIKYDCGGCASRQRTIACFKKFVLIKVARIKLLLHLIKVLKQVRIKLLLHLIKVLKQVRIKLLFTLVKSVKTGQAKAPFTLVKSVKTGQD